MCKNIANDWKKSLVMVFWNMGSLGSFFYCFSLFFPSIMFLKFLKNSILTAFM